MDYQYRKQRLAYFDSIIGEYPDHDFVHRSRDWPYHTQNPWGSWVTGYCRFLEDAHRHVCSLARNDAYDRDGLYVSWWLDSSPCLQFWAFTNDETIDREAYEYWMERFYELVVGDPESFGPNLGTELVRVGVARR